MSRSVRAVNKPNSVPATGHPIAGNDHSSEVTVARHF